MKLTKLSQLLDQDNAKKYDWQLTPDHRLVYKAEGEDEEFKLDSSLISVMSTAAQTPVIEAEVRGCHV